MNFKAYVKPFCILTASLCCLTLLLLVFINVAVCGTASSQIVSPTQSAALKDIDCILVLGCGVHEDGTPTNMLEDRIKRGIELYQNGTAPKLLMSGDHGREDYNEVATMKAYAVQAGIPSNDIFMDHAGFSTYESLVRAKEVFHAKRVVIVTQEYHLYRALYIAEQLGLEAYGVDAQLRPYGGQFSRDVREVLARVKDFVSCLFKPAPTYLGEAIPVSGNGDSTNDSAWDDLAFRT